MYKRHPDFQEIPGETVIWQYMPLSKFINLLRLRKLYFNRIDNFKDSSECSLTAIDQKILRYSENAKGYWDRERKRHYISCWLESDYELALMWDTYGKDGVAIKTTVNNLIDALKEDKEHYQYLSRVKYIDEKKECAQDDGEAINVLKIPFTKRIYFEQEREIRVLFTQYDVNDQKGVSFPINLNVLINVVMVHPNAPQYFLDIFNEELRMANLNIMGQFSEI